MDIRCNENVTFHVTIKTMEESLPIQIQEFIKEYEGLSLGGKLVQCPYFMNIQKKKDLRAMLGKGTPEEIITEANIWAKVKGVQFRNMSEEEIKNFLINRGIGIDCSGFVSHVLNEWYLLEKGKSIWNEIYTPRKSLLNWIKFKLRPVEKIGANLLTSTKNATEISLKEIHPGDVVRLKWKKRNSHHILLVYQVERNENGDVVKIVYKHSTPYYDKNNGVKTGEIEITDVSQSLENQNWTEKDEHGVNFTHEGYMVQLEDNGLRRINAMAEIISSHNFKNEQ